MYHRPWIVTAILLLCTVFSQAQQNHWQIIRIFPDTLSADRMDSISTGLIYARIGSASLPIPIDSITALVFCTESHFWTGVLIGVAVAAPIGGVIGATTTGRSGGLEHIDHKIKAGLVGVALGTYVGFAVGGILGSAKERRYDLEGMSDEMIRSIVRKEQD